MMNKFLRLAVITTGLVLVLSGCANAPVTDRPQLMLFTPEKFAEIGEKSYATNLEPYRKARQLDTNPRQTRRIVAISNRIIQAAAPFIPASTQWKWEIHVVDKDEINAYCAPGGKIAVYSGLINQLQATDEELAAVLAHEVAHAIANHGAEQFSAALGTTLAAALISQQAELTPEQQQALDLATALLLTLPHSRLQESEADRIGVRLMASAGFNPGGAVSVFKKMQSSSGVSKPPEFLSSHPSMETRIQDLSEIVRQEMTLFAKYKK